MHAHHFDSAPMSPLPAIEALNSSELRCEVETLRAVRDRLLLQQTQIMQLIGCADPAKVIHDIRNILNERELLRALAGTDIEE